MYRSGSSAKNEYSVIGEYYTYNGNGHTVNLYPSKTNRTQYKSILSSMASEEVLGDATIAVIFSFYVYSKDLDMCVTRRYYPPLSPGRGDSFLKKNFRKYYPPPPHSD